MSFKKKIVDKLKQNNLFPLFLKLRYIMGYASKIEKRSSKRLSEFYRNYINEGSLAYDIGANLGNRSDAFLSLGARVVAVEPQSSLASYLKFKFGKKVNVVQAAVGAQIGEHSIYLSNLHTLTTLSEQFTVSEKARHPQVKFNESKVKMVTLDWLIEKYGLPDFCKIDVEGFEVEVLKGLSQKITKISFEFNCPEFNLQTIECLEYLLKFGNYHCNYSFKETLELEKSKWLSGEELIELVKSNFQDTPHNYGDIYVVYE